jgi:hypothetical protein
MIVKGVNLVLDNFRKVYSGYSTDVQDVIRSAILDGVDITEYIDKCKNDPFRLDQLRLSVKEGFTGVDNLSKYSGEVIYSLRTLKKQGKDVKQIFSILNNGNLLSEHIEYLIKWSQKGYGIRGLNIQTIPKESLPVFTMGLGYGLDMCVYNTGVKYPDELLKRLFHLQKKGYDVSVYLDLRKPWNYEVLDFFATLSEPIYKVFIGGSVDGGFVISQVDSLNRIKLLSELVKSNIDITLLQDVSDEGYPVWSEEALSLLLSGVRKGIGFDGLYACDGVVPELRVKISEVDLSKGRKIKGKLTKG